jgi:competence protein ComEC
MIDSPLTLRGPLLFKLEVFPVYGPNENDRALVFRIKHNDFSLLVCGDIEEQGIRELLKYGEHAIQSDVIVIPHHGAFSTGLDELLRRSQPSLAIISTGENQYGHPDQRTLALLTEKHIEYYVTDQSGAVGFYLTQKNWKVVVNGKNNFSRMDEK